MISQAFPCIFKSAIYVHHDVLITYKYLPTGKDVMHDGLQDSCSPYDVGKNINTNFKVDHA